ncbi:nuclear transport factor 2 family protein [Chitinophaga rhizophila]|nr:nuclear transport factor 2 family protein [Chitinophaga rhizophila]
MSNKAILETANAAVTAGDYEAFLSYCTDDTEWTFVGDRRLQGKEAVRQYMAESYIAPPENIVEYLIAEGDMLTAGGKISMQQKDGTMANYEYCDVWTFREGKMDKLKAFVIPA